MTTDYDQRLAEAHEAGRREALAEVEHWLGVGWRDLTPCALEAREREAGARAMEDAAADVHDECPAWSDSHGLVQHWLIARAAALRAAPKEAP